MKRKRFADYVYDELKKQKQRKQEAESKEKHKNNYLKKQVETIERQKSEWRSDF